VRNCNVMCNSFSNVGIFFSLYFLCSLQHKVQKLSSGTGSPGWSRKKGRKMVVVCGGGLFFCMSSFIVRTCEVEDIDNYRYRDLEDRVSFVY